MKYTASKGGHAPGHLRDVFVEAIEGGAATWQDGLQEAGREFFFDEAFQAKWDSWSNEQRARWITGQLWNCSDIMPSDLCTELDLAPGSTYARAVRRLRADLN